MKRSPSVRLLAGVLGLVLFAGCSSASGAAPEMTPTPAADAGPPGPQQRTSLGPDGEEIPVVTTEPMLLNVDLDTIRAGRFDQGKMWTFEFPPMEYLRDAYGLTPDSTWFRRARLGALRLSNCSASFVSPNGLVMTNHHCGREYVTQVNGEGETLLDDGFYARTLAEEREVEDFDADQLIEIVDITREVEERTMGLSGGNLVEAREEVMEEIGNRMQEERGGEEAGWVVEPISLYNGAKASAYVFRRYTNAKLVMAPELQIGFFGGDPDNFTYPRYNLDFSFFRIYDDEGEPLQTEDYFRWAERGVEDGDVIFIIGNPGSTSRLQTVAELEFRRDVGDATVLEFIKKRLAVLDSFIDAYPDVAEEYDLRNSFFSLENQRKAMEGQLAGMADPIILARRKAAQDEVLDGLAADSALLAEYGDMFDEMREVQEAKREFAAGFGAFLGLTAPDLASPTLHRALLGFQVLNAQRAGAPPAQLSGLMDQLREVADRPAELDEALIEARLLEFIEQYGEDAWVEEILEGRSPEGAATAIQQGSVLNDSASAVEAVSRGTLRADDPAIAFVLAYVPALGEFQSGFFDQSNREEELAAKIGRARFEIFGTSQPPDATFSLRIADGVVGGYTYNGTEAPVYTTFYGLYDRYHSFMTQYADQSDSPWALPDRWATAPPGLDLSTPVNFVSTADIIGGNSGSPVLNELLQVVGLVFDGNIESLPGDYIYLPELNRSVAVDARGILEALEEVYDMERIATELTTGVLAPSAAGANDGGT